MRSVRDRGPRGSPQKFRLERCSFQEAPQGSCSAGGLPVQEARILGPPYMPRDFASDPWHQAWGLRSLGGS